MCACVVMDLSHFVLCCCTFVVVMLYLELIVKWPFWPVCFECLMLVLLDDGLEALKQWCSHIKILRRLGAFISLSQHGCQHRDCQSQFNGESKKRI